MNPELWGQIVVPIALAVAGFLGHQVRILHGRISKRDTRIEQIRRDADSRIAAVDEKVDAAMLESMSRLVKLETLVEGIDKKLDRINGRR